MKNWWVFVHVYRSRQSYCASVPEMGPLLFLHAFVEDTAISRCVCRDVCGPDLRNNCFGQVQLTNHQSLILQCRNKLLVPDRLG